MQQTLDYRQHSCVGKLNWLKFEWRMFEGKPVGSFPLHPPPPQRNIPIPPVEAVAAATSVFTEYVFCESVDNAHISQISSTFQEADC